MTTVRHTLETVLIDTVAWLKLIIEAIGVSFIGLGAIIAIGIFLRALVSKQPIDFARIRFSLARYLALALEFQLGADILATAVAPGWDAIGKLAAIAVIRTGLNFFLMREMAEQQTAIEPQGHTAVDS